MCELYRNQNAPYNDKNSYSEFYAWSCNCCYFWEIVDLFYATVFVRCVKLIAWNFFLAFAPPNGNDLDG